MTLIRFHELAERELEEAITDYEMRSEGLGDRFLAEVRAAVSFIQEYPESSPIIELGIRRKVLVKFPYDLFYTLETTGVLIMSVAHESRRPGFWRGRVQ
ncbi:MAG TPA: type II toxin-antitoxin system RelE/ParE family toxin [Thermoanaerobaculia bacterium]